MSHRLSATSHLGGKRWQDSEKERSINLRAAESDADDGLKGQQAEPKFSGPLPLAKRFFGSATKEA